MKEEQARANEDGEEAKAQVRENRLPRGGYRGRGRGRGRIGINR